ncbi:MAG: ribosome silencing factor [Nitrospinota bacterium]|nr:MAG: ribosome silencing factor [Nitrospinota bacterium]
MSLSAEEKAHLSTEAALDKKASHVVLLDVRRTSSFTDYFLICSGSSDRQVQTIADAIDESLGKRGIAALGVEGYQEARWVLMDYGDLVIHIFQEETRRYYDLERLWGSAAQLPTPQGSPVQP